MHTFHWISALLHGPLLRGPLTLLGWRRETRRRRRSYHGDATAGLQSTQCLEARALLAAEISIANAAAVVEGQSASFQVSLSEAASGTVTVTYSTSDGNGPTAALNGVDLTALTNQTLTFSPGQTQKVILVNTIDDAIAESTESFLVTLQSSVGASIASAQATGTITDNDAALPTLSIADAAAVTEGTAAQFTVSLSAASGSVVSVQYRTVDGDGPTGATSGTDFPGVTSQTLTFSPGQTEKTISIPTTDDSDVEGTETFEVVLTNPSQAVLSRAQAVGTLNDNDVALPALSITDAAAVDEGGNSEFTVTLSSASDTAVTVQYSTVQGDEPTAATSGVDYTAATNQTLTFDPGQTQKIISIPTTDDAFGEGEETFGLRLSNATAATIAVSQAVGTIRDNEVVPVMVSIRDAAEVTEGGSATFTVRLNMAASGVVTVDYATASGSGPTGAINDVDIVAQSGQRLTFQPGQTEKLVTVVTSDDSLPEPTETFRVVLSSAVGADISIAEATGTILDNDSDSTGSEPTILSPSGTISEQRPTFEWAAVTGAVSYDLELIHIGGANNPVIQTTVAQTSLAAPATLNIGRYRVWVRANLGGGVRTPWTSDVFDINATTTIHALPLHGSNRRPTVSWDAVAGATGYRVYFTNLSTKQQGFIDQVVTGTTFTPSSDLTFGQNRIWVRPIGINNYTAAWSLHADYLIGATLLAPYGSAPTFRPQFSWTAVPEAATYQFYLVGPTGSPTIESGITGTTFTPATDLPVGDFRWWIRPFTASGTAGTWSDVAEFSTGGRTKVTSPRGTISTTTPQLTWPAVQGATAYEVYVSKVGTSGALYRAAGLTSTTFSSRPLDNGEYRVWIRTTTATGSVWGSGVTFTVQTPTAALQATGIGPASPGFTARPQFTWQATSGAASYDLYLHNGTQAVSQTGRTGTSWTPPAALVSGGWTWWIRAVNSSGAPGPWSLPKSFNTTGDTVFLTPAASTSDRTPKFTWQPVTGAIRYMIQVDNLTTGISRVIREDALTSTSYTPTTALAAGSYRMWVRAVSSSILGEWSLRQDFTIT